MDAMARELDRERKAGSVIRKVAFEATMTERTLSVFGSKSELLVSRPPERSPACHSPVFAKLGQDATDTANLMFYIYRIWTRRDGWGFAQYEDLYHATCAKLRDMMSIVNSLLTNGFTKNSTMIRNMSIGPKDPVDMSVGDLQGMLHRWYYKMLLNDDVLGALNFAVREKRLRPLIEKDMADRNIHTSDKENYIRAYVRATFDQSTSVEGLEDQSGMPVCLVFAALAEKYRPILLKEAKGENPLDHEAIPWGFETRPEELDPNGKTTYVRPKGASDDEDRFEPTRAYIELPKTGLISSPLKDKPVLSREEAAKREAAMIKAHREETYRILTTNERRPRSPEPANQETRTKRQAARPVGLTGSPRKVRPALSPEEAAKREAARIKAHREETYRILTMNERRPRSPEPMSQVPTVKPESMVPQERSSQRLRSSSVSSTESGEMLTSKAYTTPQRAKQELSLKRESSVSSTGSVEPLPSTRYQPPVHPIRQDDHKKSSRLLRTPSASSIDSVEPLPSKVYKAPARGY